MATSVSITDLSAGKSSNSVASGKGLYRIVGLACLVGFCVDTLVLASPPNFGDLQWRVGIMQQMSDRSIILLMGATFFMMGTIEMRKLRQRLSLACMGAGILFLIFTVLVIRDGVAIQKQTLGTIDAQANQAQTQIQQLKEKQPQGTNITPEQIEKVMQRLNSQVTATQSAAKTQILKTGVSSVGNLLIVGISLIGVGRYGIRRS
jgi:hypothetical protein